MTNKHYSKAQRALSGLLAFVLLLSLTVTAFAADLSAFTDVSGHWAYDALEWAVDNGVLEGMTEDEMAPNDHLTRAQMAAMTSRLYGTYKCAEISQFTDAAPESWYYSYIAQAVNMGTFTGYSQHRMGPGDNITREQAMTILARMICLPEAETETLSGFSDRGDVASWAYDAVRGMVEREYVNGYQDGQLKPKNEITRAEMAQIMSNMFQSVRESGELTGSFQDMVLVRGPVNIHDAVFEGDLIIANGLRERKLDLNNVTVKGRLIVWGGSEIHVNGNSKVAGVVTPRNDGPVKVIFDGAASELSEQSCTIVYPESMNKDNKVTFTEKTVPEVPKPTIDFTLPDHLYVGETLEVKPTLTNADTITWSLTRAGLGKPVDGLTKDGGKIRFTQEGRYVLTGTAANEGGTSVCERSIDVLPVVGIAFSLPEYGHTDTPVDVKLLLENEQGGKVVWTLARDGADYPIPDGFTNEGGTLALPETGDYTLTAAMTDAAGKEYTARQSITILPVLNPLLTSSTDHTHEDETAEIGLTVENGTPSTIQWTLIRGGKTWRPFNEALHTADHKGETFLIRYPATRDEFASRTVTVVIPYRHGAPILSFDPDKEIIGTTPGMEYSPDGGKTWYPTTGPLDVSDLTGKDILIRYPADGDGLPGESTTIKVPARRKAPDVGHTDETKLGRNDGTLTDTDKTMEFRISDGKWIGIVGNTVKNLAPGNYEVRYAATDTDIASAIQTVTIAKGKDTSSDNNGNNGNNGNGTGNGNGSGNLTGSKLYLLNRKDHMGYISGRTTTQAAPNADITRAEVATILYRLLTADAKSAYTTKINRFSDVSGSSWYSTAVSTLANIGVIDGYQDGTFGPQRNITRAELATILARFCDAAQDTGKDHFTDISGSWARQYINQAAKAGLVNGYADGTFRPNQNITRAETIVMVNRILGRSVNADTVVKGYKSFEDVPAGAWYYWDVIEAANTHSYNKNGSTEKWNALG